MDGLALLSESDLKTRLNKDGWALTRNPHYRAEYGATDRPWRVIEKLWVDYTDRRGDLSFGNSAIARCFDPRLGQWVYRRMRRDLLSRYPEPKAWSEWYFLKPPPRPAHFDSLSEAKSPLLRSDLLTWVRDDG